MPGSTPCRRGSRSVTRSRPAKHSPVERSRDIADAAVLLLCHTNRVASPNARNRYGATYALRQKARLTLYAQQDDEGYLLIGPEKANRTAEAPQPVRHHEQGLLPRHRRARRDRAIAGLRRESDRRPASMWRPAPRPAPTSRAAIQQSCSCMTT